MTSGVGDGSLGGMDPIREDIVNELAAAQGMGLAVLGLVGLVCLVSWLAQGRVKQ